MSAVETDCFRLGRHELFRVLRAQLPEQLGGLAQNLIECKDDILFAWNASEGSVLCLNWRAAYTKDGDQVAYQTLIPTTPQVFTVDKLTVSAEGSFLALSGNRGVAIMELPRRWGPNGQYQAGKERICCTTYNLDERFFIGNSRLEVRQVRWHPASPKDSHLLVLLSNNTIRLYEEQSLRVVWRVGPLPSSSPTSITTTPYLNALGDTAVDFDIAPPRAVVTTSSATASAASTTGGVTASGNDTATNGNGVKDANANPTAVAINDSHSGANTNGAKVTRVEWPLILLRGNGQLYIVLIGIDTERPLIQGPLAMTPATANNYGLEYCSVLVLPSQPPTIVMAETNGNLHHAVLLEAVDDEAEATAHSTPNGADASLRVVAAEWCVHVLETVQLELGLAGAAATAAQRHQSCEIFLKRDAINDSRYFAYHETGLHAVTVEFIAQLARYADPSYPNANPDASNLLDGRPSHAEYLVCTQALDSARPNAVLGFTLLSSPAGLVLLLASGQLVSLNLIADSGTLHDLAAAAASGTPSAAAAARAQALLADQQSFELHIGSLLRSSVTQPLLQLSRGADPSAKETLELLMHATHVLREQYFAKHDRVKAELEKRVRLLQMMRKQQLQDLAQLQADKERLRGTAERLAERYEDCQERQAAVFRRAQDVARQVSAADPQSAVAEAEFRQQVDKIGGSVRRLAGSIAGARKIVEQQQAQVEQYQGRERQRAKPVVLQPRMEATIRALMTEINADIETQIKEVKNIRAHANLS